MAIAMHIGNNKADSYRPSALFSYVIIILQAPLYMALLFPISYAYRVSYLCKPVVSYHKYSFTNIVLLYTICYTPISVTVLLEYMQYFDCSVARIV